MKKNIFISTTSFRLKNFLKYKNKYSKFNVTANPLNRKLNKKELINFAKKSNVIIAGTEKYDYQVLKNLKDLKLIFRLGSGVDNIDLKVAKKLKIKIKNNKITPYIPVSEMVISNIINLLRKISKHDQNMRKNIWKKEMGYTLNGKIIGIVGYGKIGKYLRKLLSNYGVKVIFFDKIDFKSKYQFKLNDLLKKADIISLHLSLNKSSRNLINKAKIKLLKKNSIIINTSRPEIIDYNSLYSALKKNRIQGAALDVFPNEPYFGKFKKLDNIILTPHIGSYAIEIRDKMEDEAIKSILEF